MRVTAKHSKSISTAGIIFTTALLFTMSAWAQPMDSASALPLAPSGTWTFTGNLHQAREEHTATLLPNGNVLVAGGAINGIPIVSSEVYNPTSRTWTPTQSLHIDRA